MERISSWQSGVRQADVTINQMMEQQLQPPQHHHQQQQPQQLPQQQYPQQEQQPFGSHSHSVPGQFLPLNKSVTGTNIGDQSMECIILPASTCEDSVITPVSQETIEAEPVTPVKNKSTHVLKLAMPDCIVSLLKNVKKKSQHVTGVARSADREISCDVDISQEDDRIEIIITGREGSVVHSSESLMSCYVSSLDYKSSVPITIASPRRSARKSHKTRKDLQYHTERTAVERIHRKKVTLPKKRRKHVVEMEDTIECKDTEIESEISCKSPTEKENETAEVESGKDQPLVIANLDLCQVEKECMMSEIIQLSEGMLEKCGTPNDSSNGVTVKHDADDDNDDNLDVKDNNHVIEVKPIYRYHRHMGIPSTLKQRCLLCNKLFLLVSTLHRHIRRVHRMTLPGYETAVQKGILPDGAILVQPPKQPQIKLESAVPGRKRGTKTRSRDDPSVKLMYCAACSKEYMTTKALWLHIETHQGRADYHQIVMEMEYQMARRKAINPIEVACSLCQQPCIGNQVLVHLKKWHNTNEHCTEHMEKLKTKIAHIREQRQAEKNPKQVEQVTCGMCGKKVSKRVLNHHMKRLCRQNPDRIVLFRCKICYTETLSQAMLDEHMANKHPPDMRYQCETCGNDYKRLSSLIIHRKKVHGVSKKTLVEYPCPICKKVFHYPYDLKTHSFTHTDNRDCPCEICGKLFKSRVHVRDHIRTQHLNKYTYHCKKCGHGVQKKQYLTSHLCGRVRRKQAGDDSSQVEILNIETVSKSEGAGQSTVDSGAGIIITMYQDNMFSVKEQANKRVGNSTTQLLTATPVPPLSTENAQFTVGTQPTIMNNSMPQFSLATAPPTVIAAQPVQGSRVEYASSNTAANLHPIVVQQKHSGAIDSALPSSQRANVPLLQQSTIPWNNDGQSRQAWVWGNVQHPQQQQQQQQQQ